MNNKISKILAFLSLIFCSMILFVHPVFSAATVDLPDEYPVTGNEVTVPVNLDVATETVDGFVLRVCYDKSVLSNPELVTESTLSSGKEINFTTSPGDNIGDISVGYMSGLGASSDGVLVKIKFNVLTAFSGTKDITFTSDGVKTVLYKSGFNTISTTFTDGTVEDTRQTGFKENMVLISKFGTESTAEAYAGSLTLSTSSFANDGYVFAGSNSKAMTSLNSSNADGYSPILARAWYIQLGTSKPTTTTFKFNITGVPVSYNNYGLLRTSDSGLDASSFSEVETASSVDTTNRIVTFNLASAKLIEGYYYTLGIKDDTSDSLFVDLYSFNAITTNGTVILEWTTTMETDNAGFNILRSDTKDGEYVKINDTLILSIGDSFTGATYTFEDTSAVSGQTYYYLLEDIDEDGNSNLNGILSPESESIKVEARDGEEDDDELIYDANNDGNVDIGDVIYLLKILTGIDPDEENPQ